MWIVFRWWGDSPCAEDPPSPLCYLARTRRKPWNQRTLNRPSWWLPSGRPSLALQSISTVWTYVTPALWVHASWCDEWPDQSTKLPTKIPKSFFLLLQELTPDYSMESHQRDHETFLVVSRNRRRRAKALLDFERHDDDELGFRKNDIITVSWLGAKLSPLYTSYIKIIVKKILLVTLKSSCSFLRSSHKKMNTAGSVSSMVSEVCAPDYK